MNRFAYICADPGIPVPGTKGSSIHVASVVAALRAKGLRGTVHCARAKADELVGCSLHRLPTAVKSPNVTDAARELRLLGANVPLGLDGVRPDFVYERYSLWHYAGLLEARRLGVPFVLEVNSPLPHEASQYRSLAHPTMANGVAETLFRNADGVVCVSDAVAEWVRGMGASADRVWTIPNGVDADLFSPDGPTTEAIESPFHEETTVLVFSGSFRPWHGLTDLVNAFDTLRGRGHDVGLLMIGDGPERVRCQESIEELGLARFAHFTGAVAPDQVPAYTRLADIAMAPYPALDRFYFSPLKLLEYMALALPVVSSDIGQIGGLVTHDERGLLCAPGEVHEVVSAVESLIDDPDKAARLGNTAREWVLDNATWGHRVDEILARVGGVQ